jgi:hypothetical protein
MELTIWDDGCKFQADGCTCSSLHKLACQVGHFTATRCESQSPKSVDGVCCG